mgnify:CR=1 FL=1
MSLIKKINSVIDDRVKLFIKQVSESHSIEEDELWGLWSDEKPIKKPIVDSESTMDPKELNKLLLVDIKAICKDRGIKTSGTKAVLITALCGENVEVKSKSNSKSNSEPPVIKKITASIPVISIRRNQFGNSEHPETSFVFDKNKKVYGKQNTDGSVDKLTEKDIDICNKYKFLYILPTNLDEKSDQIDEDEDDEEVDSDDEELDEEEEEELLEDESEEELLDDEF